MKKILIFILIICAVTAAQSKRQVAVLPTVADANALDPEGQIILTDKVREIASNNLPQDKFILLKQDVIANRLGGEEEFFNTCKEGTCVAELTKRINADYGARCDIIKRGNDLAMKFELYSVRDEAILGTFTKYPAKDLVEMLAELEARLPAAFKKMVDTFKEPLYTINLKPEPEPEPAAPEVSQETQVEKQADSVQPAQQTIPVKQEKIKYETYEESDGKPRSLKKRISLELGGAFSPYGSARGETGDYGYGSGVGGGWYLRADFIYAEIVLDIVTNKIFFDGGIGVLGKYPIGNDVIKVFPLLGFGGSSIGTGFGFTGGGRVDVGITEIGYLRSEYLLWLADELAMSFKIGGGLDIGLGERKKFYVRPELMYNYKWAKYGYDVENFTVQHLDLKVGIGYKWGGQKRVKEQ